MRLAKDCDVVARAGHYEVVATGLKKSASVPHVAAANWCAANGKRVIGVEGVHGVMQVCGKATASNNVRPTNASVLPELHFVGVSLDAQIGGATWWKQSGEPGPMTFEDLRVQTVSPNKALFLVAQHNHFPHLARTFRRVHGVAHYRGTKLAQIGSGVRSFWNIVTGDGPLPVGVMWWDRGHGSTRSVEYEECSGDGFEEHGISYVCNVQEFVKIVRCFVSDTGRTAVQICNRQWEDKARTISTKCPSTPESAVAIIKDNLFANCGSYFVDTDSDGDVDQTWANGSALTIAGFPGDVEISGNRIYQTHAGGGGIAVWADTPKIGSYLRTDGWATGHVKVHDNLLHCIAGAKSGREAVQIGHCASLDWRRNTLSGSEKRITLHGGKVIGAVASDSPQVQAA